MWEKILEIPQTLTITPEWVDLGEDLYGITIRESENQATIQINNSFDWLYDLDGNPETISDLNHEIKKPLELSENIPIHNYIGTEKFDLMTTFLHEIGHALGL